MDVIQVIQIDGSRSALPRTDLPSLVQVTTIANVELAKGLQAFLADIDATFGAVSEQLENIEVAEVELSVAVSAEGKIGLVLSAGVGATVSLKITVRPKAH